MASKKKGKEETPVAEAPPEILEGDGSFVHESKSAKYEGHWVKKDGKMLMGGRGKYTEGKQWYEGDFVDDTFCGSGSFHFASGAVYEGQFEKGMFNGRGKYLWPDGSFYEGQWRDNKMHGEGMFHDTEGKEWHGTYAGGSGPGLHLKV